MYYSLSGGNRNDVTTNCAILQLRRVQLPGFVVPVCVCVNSYISCECKLACAYLSSKKLLSFNSFRILSLHENIIKTFRSVLAWITMNATQVCDCRLLYTREQVSTRVHSKKHCVRPYLISHRRLLQCPHIFYNIFSRTLLQNFTIYKASTDKKCLGIFVQLAYVPQFHTQQK